MPKYQIGDRALVVTEHLYNESRILESAGKFVKRKDLNENSAPTLHASIDTEVYTPAQRPRMAYTKKGERQAALHFNENSTREQAVDRDGHFRHRMEFPKYKKEEHIVRLVKVDCTYDYVNALLAMAKELPPVPPSLCNDFFFHPDKADAAAGFKILCNIMGQNVLFIERNTERLLNYTNHLDVFFRF